MENVMEKGFLELTMDEQTEINGGAITVALAIVLGATVATALVVGPIVYNDLKNVYNNAFNEVRYK